MNANSRSTPVTSKASRKEIKRERERERERERKRENVTIRMVHSENEARGDGASGWKLVGSHFISVR